MIKLAENPYRTWAPTYRDLGLVPLPLKDKACKETGWQKDFPPERIDEWIERCPDYNIGLRMGTNLPDGTRLGALDIDHDAYVDLGKAILNDPQCGRIGKKGAVFFVRYQHSIMKNLKKKKFRVKGEHGENYGQVLELLFEGTLCVIPPSIHPETEAPYRWIGTPLHEINFNDLPLIGE